MCIRDRSASLHPVCLYFQTTVFSLAVRRAGRKVSIGLKLLATGLIAATTIPFYLVTITSGDDQAAWIGPLTPERVARAVTHFLGGVPGILVSTPLVLAGVIKTCRERRASVGNDPDFAHHFQSEILICVPIILLLAQSTIVNGFSGRYLTPLVPVLAIEVFKGAQWLSSARTGGSRRIVVVLFAFALASLLPQGLLFKERDRGGNYREVARILSQDEWTGKQLIVTDPILAQGLWFYATGELRSALFPQPDSDPRPWDKFEHALPLPFPTACRIVVLDQEAPPNGDGKLTDLFGRSWEEQTRSLLTTSVGGYWASTYESRNC